MTISVASCNSARQEASAIVKASDVMVDWLLWFRVHLTVAMRVW